MHFVLLVLILKVGQVQHFRETRGRGGGGGEAEKKSLERGNEIEVTAIQNVFFVLFFLEGADDGL